MSKARAVQSQGLNSSERGPIESSQASLRTAGSGSTATRGTPEWTTQRWKLQVEAEARRRLKKNIRRASGER
jgi:hypothetical protein